MRLFNQPRKAALGCLLLFFSLAQRSFVVANQSPPKKNVAKAALQLLSEDKNKRIYAKVKVLLAQRQTDNALEGLYNIYLAETEAEQIDGLYDVICLLDKSFCSTLAERLAKDYTKAKGRSDKRNILEKIFRFKPNSQNNLHQLRMLTLHECLIHFASVRGMAQESSYIITEQCTKAPLVNEDAPIIIQQLDPKGYRTHRAAWLALALHLPHSQLSEVQTQRLIEKVKASVADEYDDDMDELAAKALCKLAPESQPDGNCPEASEDDSGDRPRSDPAPLWRRVR